ncbi:MAG: cytochrome c biogenesis heme-transporting ATPase CcmA [Gammaproteobacteria bacterium]|nr:cytochrome c biogenesis heme-transporting ATPase CcmA [Gammaproteobacteria bacterium]MBU1553211.1 cytochrome c biogenesis heme-transporting ATPase CcmA [Gammaproteobacteria bacterium]MBU2069622.1 cytochrome c biogenesis heme-transporting ATPase CcmA [Gammaproteobacteria bacterium]MBU2184487.1 cytochrome c biogenesis heme-transporting ATPase CcmA [Gammaproteobacteria bacterium]MBU2205169.1 cytochrome c biogenesis heme-transporting ATPase CcmA [Gammaproteobacteria bacterium]
MKAALFPVPGGETVLSARQLSCIRQDRVLFEQLDLSVAAGQLLQIAGKNGAGKSSLLRILAGLAQPEQGQLYFGTTPLRQVMPEFAANLCYIGHQSGVHEQLTARENIRFWHAATAEPQAIDDYALLGQLGLAGLEDIPCRMLSAGQQRRVSLARLWFTRRQLWILDEPFTALDQAAITMLQQHFLLHLQQGGAIVLTTHQKLTLVFEQLISLELAYRW